MKAIPRLLRAVALLAAVLLTATACDTSPYAAVVNSQVIKQTELNAELRDWASNTAYVEAFNSANGSSGVTVAGDAPGTYSSTWVASILDNDIVAALVHQRLEVLGEEPDQATIEAARAVSEISQIGWYNFPPPFRDALVMRLADEATLTPPSIDRATLMRVYEQYRQYFFSRVCVREAVTFSLARARRLSSNGEPGGARVCFDQAQLEQQPAPFRQAVMSLAPGKVSAPIRTQFGYEVLEVVSRVRIGFTPELQRIISVAIVNAQGRSNPAVEALVARAKVKVNPMYGTWRSGQVVPPRPPGASA